MTLAPARSRPKTGEVSILRGAALVAASLLAAGCYRSHRASELDAGVDAAVARRDAGPRDAGHDGGIRVDADVALPDAGPPPPLDGWTDPILVFQDGSRFDLQRTEHVLVAYEGGFGVFYLVNDEFSGVAGALYDTDGHPVAEPPVYPPPATRDVETRILAAHAAGDRCAVFWQRRDGTTWRRWVNADGTQSEAERADTTHTTDTRLFALDDGDGHWLVWDRTETTDQLDAMLRARGPSVETPDIDGITDADLADPWLVLTHDGGHRISRVRRDGRIESLLYRTGSDRDPDSARVATRGDTVWALIEGMDGTRLETFPARPGGPIGFAGARLRDADLVWMRDLIAITFEPDADTLDYQLLDPVTEERPEGGAVIGTTAPCSIVHHTLAAHGDALAVSWIDYCPSIRYRVWIRIRTR